MNGKEPLINKLVDEIKAGYKPEKIILFGSYAWGKPDEESDIDLLIIKQSEKPFHKRWSDVCRLVSGLRRGIAFSPFVITPEELQKRLDMGDQFFKKIINEGEVLYGE
ncbi:MAG: nucleotidyltransferase domain-containing protein [Candidatus Altiarchaeales archaeon]|nr:nucleotidyltransferase domain-containing protein [Candidatus Altiarchaeota archaeon]MBU4266930.1 nucleotidyltransferase domain-containing protein [Candidatus Altiarchaeota archaeon]MCG2782701.1 nucleotidyltransferase domain-containing protein [Candidatus Altiarchaeales archaeon]